MKCRDRFSSRTIELAQLGAILLKNNRFGTEMCSIIQLEQLAQLFHHWEILF